MTGGDQGEPVRDPLPSPPPGDAPVDAGPPPPPPPPQIAPDAQPELPRAAAAPPPSAAPVPQPTRGASTWYRTDQDRFKSVRRRANPWYRRGARGIVALCPLGVLAFGLYLGASELSDYLNRDRLPSPGSEIPDFRATSFQVRSSAPAPSVDGTITLDVRSGAFEFVARTDGPQSGIQVVSPENGRYYVRAGSGAWRVAGVGDGVVADVRTAVGYLIDVDNADDLLSNRARDYTELVERETEGTDEDELTRYEMTIDTADFSDDFPLQWTSFRRRAIPGVVEAAELPVTMWIDADNVLVRLQDTETNWAWERLTYVSEGFTPDDPADELLDATTPAGAITDAANDDASDDTTDEG